LQKESAKICGRKKRNPADHADNRRWTQKKSQIKSAKICGKKTIIPLIAQMNADRRRKMICENLREKKKVFPRIT